MILKKKKCFEMPELFQSEDGRLRIYQCDFLLLTTDVVDWKFDSVWDIQSLVSINPRDRKQYVRAVRSLLKVQYVRAVRSLLKVQYVCQYFSLYQGAEIGYSTFQGWKPHNFFAAPAPFKWLRLLLQGAKNMRLLAVLQPCNFLTF